MTGLTKLFVGLILAAIVGLTPIGAYFYGKHVQVATDKITMDKLSNANQAAIDAAKAQQKKDDDARLQRAQAALDALQQIAKNAVKSFNADEAKINALKKIPADNVWLSTPVPHSVACVLDNPSSC